MSYYCYADYLYGHSSHQKEYIFCSNNLMVTFTCLGQTLLLSGREANKKSPNFFSNIFSTCNGQLYQQGSIALQAFWNSQKKKISTIPANLMCMDATSTLTIRAEPCPIVFQEAFPFSQAGRNIVKLNQVKNKVWKLWWKRNTERKIEPNIDLVHKAMTEENRTKAYGLPIKVAWINKRK